MNEFSERFLRNTGLFPERIFDAELKRKLSDYPKKSSEIEAILALFDTAFERYKSLKDRLPDEDEEHLEVRFLKPVFERLGYELGKTYDFRPGIRRSHFVRKVPHSPDRSPTRGNSRAGSGKGANLRECTGKAETIQTGSGRVDGVLL